MRNLLVGVCLPLLAVAQTGCGRGDDPVPASCLPGESPTVEPGLEAARSLGVYLDVSQSVTNFGQGRGESPYRDLIAWLLDLQPEFFEVRRYGFAQRLAEVDEDVFVGAARGDVGPCAACGFQESRLNEVLATIAAPGSQNSLDVVITDLWVDNSDLIGSARLALQSPIRSILRDGRAIGVLGVTAPYGAEVYDVPSETGTLTIPAGSVEQRPVFALVIGPPEQVAVLGQRIPAEVLVDFGRTEWHFSLFTPALAGSAEQPMLPRGDGVRPAYILAIEDGSVPGFLIDRRAPNTLAGNDDATRPELAAPISGVGGSVPTPVRYQIHAEAWALLPGRASAACEADAWAPVDVGGALQITTDSGGPAIGLNISHPDLFAIRPGEIAFIRYRVAAGGVQRGGAGTGWLEAWSFGDEEAPALLADPPSLFPTLNLGEMGRILEIAMSEQITGQTVAHGSVLLSVE